MIVITTPTGNVGTEIVRQLAHHQPALPFRTASRNPEAIHKQFGAEIEAVKFDFLDRSTWPTALQDVSILFFVLAEQAMGSERGLVLSFIDAAIQAGCQHIIFVSMPVGDRVKFVPHYAVERHLEASSVAYTIIRPGYYMQNFLRKVPTHDVDIIKHHEIFLPVGTGKMAMIDADDVGAVVAKIIEHPEAHKNKAYQLTGSQSLNFYQVAAAFSKGLGTTIRYRKPGLLHFCWRLLRRGVTLPMVLFMSVEYTVTRLHMGEGQTNTLSELLDRPATTLEEFVVQHRQHWLPQSVGR